MQIRFEPDRLRPWPSSASHTFADLKLGLSVTLNPGLNEIDEDDLEVITSSPAYLQHEEFGTIQILDKPKAPEPKPTAPTK